MNNFDLYCNWQPAKSKQELLDLLANGNAIKVDDYWVIKQHHANSLNDFLHIAQHYKKHFSTNMRYILFRGQNRDYLSKDNILKIEPVAYRTKECGKWLSDEISKMYFSCKQDNLLLNVLLPWANVLTKEFNLNTKTGAFFKYQQDGDIANITRLAIDKNPAARITSNPILMALLQHYGFPTPNLDTTLDPVIALWFALHNANSENEEVTYSPILDWTENLTHKQPSVYIYSDNVDNVYDLTKILGIKRIAKRPIAQKACLISFRRVSRTYYRSPGTPVMSVTPNFGRAVIPIAVIKVHFDASNLLLENKHLTSEFLFPKDELLYKRLIENNVPYVTKYK